MGTVEALPHGLHRGIDHDSYHAPVLGMVSNTALQEVLHSPLHYHAWVTGESQQDTPAFAFGRGFHCAVLEPECFNRTYAVEPDFGDCRFKQNKAARDDWRANRAGMQIVSEEDWDTWQQMTAAVRAHPIAGRLVRDGEAELTCRWRDPETGLECKSRADYWVKRLSMVADVKTTLDASAEAFSRDAFKYGYHIQEALYREGFAAVGEPIKHFVFICVEKRPPFAVAVHSLNEHAVTRGYERARVAKLTLAECLRTNTWPGYPETINRIALPAWADREST